MLADFTWEPPYDWAVAGGPALLVDTEETKTPQEVGDFLESQGLLGQPIGIYRIAAPDDIPHETWSGVLPKPSETATAQVDQTTMQVHRFTLSWADFLDRLTFGAFWPSQDLTIHQGRPSWGKHTRAGLHC